MAVRSLGPISRTRYGCDVNGIYPIVDVTQCASLGVDPIELARALLDARPAIMQLRAKDLGAREVLAMLRALRTACDSAQTLLFANDRPDLALAAGCDGVHLGQDDVPLEEVRRIAPSLRVGLSTHDSRQFESALAVTPDYVALGPLFATRSKLNPDPVVSSATLRAAGEAARRAGIPLVGIGGITGARLARVAPHVSMAAVIGAITGTPSLQRARLSELQRDFRLAQ